MAQRNIIPDSFYGDEAVWGDKLYPYNLPKKVAIVTTTMYPSREGLMDRSTELRAKLALKTFEKALELGVRVYTVDSGSDGGWVQKARDLGALVFEEDLEGIPGEHPMGRSRRQAFRKADGYDVVVWLEPEKHPFVIATTGRSPLLDISGLIYTKQADLVVPRRIDELMSYPFQQRASEITGNLTIHEIMDSHLENGSPYLDLFIGPRAIGASALNLFREYNGRLNENPHDQWQSIFAPVWMAQSRGLSVKGSPVDFIYPEEQKYLEIGNPQFAMKRIYQLKVLSDAVRDFVEEDKMENLRRL